MIVSLVVSLSCASLSLLYLLVASLSMAYDGPLSRAAEQLLYFCTVSLAQYSPIASPPPASIATGTRYESKSQACGPREVNSRTRQSANACQMSGRVVTSLNSARVDASMVLGPIGIIDFEAHSCMKADCKNHLRYAAQSNEGATKHATKFRESEGKLTPPSQAQNLHPHWYRRHSRV